MLSDTMHDTVEEIKDYIERYPDIYGGELGHQLYNLMGHMKNVQFYLDVDPDMLPMMPEIPPVEQGFACYIIREHHLPHLIPVNPHPPKFKLGIPIPKTE